MIKRKIAVTMGEPTGRPDILAFIALMPHWYRPLYSQTAHFVNQLMVLFCWGVFWKCAANDDWFGGIIEYMCFAYFLCWCAHYEEDRKDGALFELLEAKARNEETQAF